MFADRRGRLLEAIRGVAIVASAPVTIRNNDVEHEYRQDSDMQYLTGFEEPDSVLVLSRVHPEHRAVLFLRERDKEREQWDGFRLGVEGAVEKLGVDAAFPIGELRKRLPEYLTGAPELVYELGKRPDLDAIVLAAINQVRARGRAVKPWPRSLVHPDGPLHELRLIKSEAELDRMRRAAAISAEAHHEAMRRAGPGRDEYEIDALLRHVFRSGGAAREAYPPIVGSGVNATVLHYRENRRRMEDGDLLLLDAGCEYEHYAADITRTFPVNGRFSPAQRAVYQAVLDAQLAAIEETKPGSTIERVHQVALHTLIVGMLRIGLLSGTVDSVLADESYKRFYMHRTSHWLGMDVHDVGAYFVGGEPRAFVPGVVLTIEPGIYVSAHDDEVAPEFRGLGVRIEDDVLVTASGHEVMTAAAPKTIDEIERACQS
ncbi:MAG: aminopeptidase P N-terminal domain-containing protein [Deltaproteobacteria bacterium]|nr:aminopeptidase P N-terminal domain-containing protein [Deltaproteobacteria bacterium]